MSVQPTCPACGAELSRDAPSGLCPRCLLRVALSGQAASSASGETAQPSGQDPALANDSTHEVPIRDPIEPSPTEPDERAPALHASPTADVPSPCDIPTVEVPGPGDAPTFDARPGPAPDQ